MSDAVVGKQAVSEKAAPAIAQPLAPQMGAAPATPQAGFLALHDDAGNEAITSALNASNGRSLDSQTRAFMESRFGQPLHQVRIHTGETAVRANSTLKSDAFAYGQHIWFNRGQFDPGSESGLHLLAHELAHTIQQRQKPVGPQAKISLGSEISPTETNADLAADAVMRNGRLPAIRPAQPMIRRRKTSTKPTVTPVKGSNNQYIVEIKDGDTDKRYRVTRHVRMVPKKGNKPSITGHINKNDVWLQIEWCKNSTKGKIKVGANLPKQVQELLKKAGKAILNNGDMSSILDGIDVTPFVSVTITQSGDFRISAKGQVTVAPVGGEVKRGGGGIQIKLSKGIEIDLGLSGGKVPGTNRTDIRGDAKLTFRFGKGAEVPKVSCPIIDVGPEISYTCEEEISAHPETRTRPVTKTKTVYLYYHYAKPDLENDPRMPGKQLNDQNLPQLYNLLQNKWQANRITGYASPEGPMEQQPGSKFQGNRKLSEERAQAAKTLIEEKCKPSLLDMRQKPSCFTEDFQTVTGNELYSPEPDESGKEAKGTPLAKAAVGSFLSEENDDREARHRTPELKKKLEARKHSPQKQAELVYPLLRRTEISLVRQETEKYQVTIPARWQPIKSCPNKVKGAVEDSL